MKFAKIFLASILALIFFTGCAQMQSGSSGIPVSPVLDRIQQRGELLVGTMLDLEHKRIYAANRRREAMPCGELSEILF